ncbi:hypothetical protein CF326_g3738 [Tilletia indica]|nr:hypothetical protein CF326_g3738 [Tilletia indica]
MTAAGGVANAGGSAGGVTGLPPMFTPIIFCLPSEGSSLSLNPLTSTSTSTSALASVGGDTSTASNQDGDNTSSDQHPAEASKSLPAVLLPIANRPIIAFALQQLVSAGIRHAILCAPAAHHTLIAHTLRQLHLITHGTTTTTTTPNVQVLVDPLPGTSRRSNPSASTYILRLDLVPLGPADRTDKTRMSAAGTTASSLQPSIETNSRSSSRKKNRVLGSAELLLWLASEGWLEADPLILPYDLLTPSLPLTALLRAHQIAAALLPSTNFAPGSGPRNSLPSHPLLLGATTLLIERRSPANTRSNGAKGDAASKERLKAEKSALVGSGTQGDRLVVYSKEDFGALHGFSSSTLAAPHTGGFTSCPPSSSTTTTLIAEAPHSAHALLSSTPLVQAQSRSKSTSYVLPPGVGTQSLSSLHNQSRITASAHISTSLLDSGIYVLPRAIILPLLERFSSPSPSGSTQPKIRTIPHLVSLLARASSDTRYARKMGIDNLVRRLARSFAQTHAQRAGLDPVRGVLRTGTTDGGRDSLGASISVAGVAAVGSGGGGVGGGIGIGAAASLADSVQFGSAVASPNMLASPPTISTSRRPHLGRQSSASASSPSARANKDGQDESAADALLAELGTSMSRLSVSIAAAHSSASRSSITGERSSTAVRPFSTPSSSSSSSGAAPAEIRVQALVARLETDAEAFVWGRADEVSATGLVAGKGGKGAGGAGSAPQVEQERFLGKVDTPARYLEANRFLLRALAAPTPSPLFPIPSISEAGSLGTAPPIEGGAAPPSQPQITPDALIASHSSTTLGDRCVIRRSVVGKGCTIARGAKILGCVLMNGVSVGENAKLESVILAPHTTVGARSSLVDVDAGPEGVRIPDGTEAKATRFGNGVSGGGGAGAAGGGPGGKKAGRGPQALGFDESAVVAGLLQDDDDDDSEDSEEEESEEEDD